MTKKFLRENDMTTPVVQGLLSLCEDKNWAVFTECSGPIGIADVVMAQVNFDALSSRVKMGLAPLLDPVIGKAFFALSLHETCILDDLAIHLGYSAPYLWRRGVRPLVDCGYVSMREGVLSVSKRLPKVFERVVAVELKLSDWRAGLHQARRYQHFANKVYLALDSSYVHRVVPYTQELLAQNVGLLSVDSQSLGLSMLADPRWSEPISTVDHAVVGERLLAASIPKEVTTSYENAATGVLFPIPRGGGGCFRAPALGS